MSTPHDFVAHDASFARVTGRRPRLVEVVATDAHEGPVYVAGEDALYFTTVPRWGPSGSPAAAVHRLALDGERLALGPDRVTRVPVDVTMPNGMALDADGGLLICEQGDLTAPARVGRLDLATGGLTSAADRSGGRPLNSPNDVAVHPRDGAVWFTDPSYGHLQGFRPRPPRPDAVHRVDPLTGRAEAVAGGFDKPNGLAFSPDGRVLYVADSGAIHGPGTWDPGRPHHVEAFDVDGATAVRRRRVAVVSPGYPDGLKVDREGRLYVSGGDGVHVLSPEGLLLGVIRIPGAVNFTFGGRDRNVLFVTADTAVWAAVLDVAGAEPVPSLLHPTGA